MAKLDARVTYLESQVCTSLENLDSFSVQLMVIQDFLQKQFGSRFIDYAATRGVLIEKPKPVKQGFNNFYSGPATAATSTFLSNEEEDLVQGDEGDPMAYLEIGTEGEQGDNDNGEYGEEEELEDGVYDEEYSYGVYQEEEGMQEGYYEGEEEEEEGGQEGGDEGMMMMGEGDEEEEEYHQDSGVGSSGTSSNLLKSSGGLPTPPQVTTRPKAKAAYNNKGDESASKKARLPSNFLGRKRQANTSAGESSAPKMPVLQPQTEASSDGYVGLEDILDYGINEGGLGEGMYEGHRDPECNEDLREYYDVLPDKSVQCKICDKILKAGWHKFGRHYRTHTGEKPFSCPTCGESFARKDNMNNHIKSKHENKRPVSRNPRDNVTMASEFSPLYYLSNELISN